MEIWPGLYHRRPDYPGGPRARFERIMAAALLHQHLDIHCSPSARFQLGFLFLFPPRRMLSPPSLKCYSSYVYSLALDLILYLPHLYSHNPLAGVIGRVTYIVHTILQFSPPFKHEMTQQLETNRNARDCFPGSEL